MSNPNYTTQAPDRRAWAVEQSIRPQWMHVAARAHPLLATVIPKMGKVSNDGSKLIWPLLFDQALHISPGQSGILEVNMTQSGVTRTDNIKGGTQAEVPVATVLYSFQINARERTKARQPGAKVYDMKLKAVLEARRLLLSQSLSSGNSPTEDRIMGMYFPLSQGNNYAGVNQVSNRWWRANVVSGISQLTLSVIDSDMDVLTRRQGKSPDLLLLAFPDGGLNMFNLVRQLLGPQLRLQAADKKIYDMQTFMINNMTCVMDRDGRNGNYLMLTSDTWDATFDENISFEYEKSRSIETYSAVEMAQVVCIDPANQLIRSGVTN